MADDDLERGLHERLALWARDHASRYDDIGVLDYEPELRAEQRISTSRTDAIAEDGEDGLLGRLTAGYLQTLGAGSGAIIDALASRRDELLEALAAGRNVAILTGHADRLDDVGAFSGGVALALGDPALIGRNGTILNKVMTRESFKGRPMTDLMRLFGNVYWVIPDSDSARRWSIDPRAIRYVNANAMRSLVRDMREGIVLTLAPSGSTMRAELGEDGQVRRIVVPPVAPATAKLIGRFDAYLVAALWEGRCSVSPLYDMEPIEVSMDRLARVTEELAGVPVEHAGTSGEPVLDR